MLLLYYCQVILIYPSDEREEISNHFALKEEEKGIAR
jgi:hypothetical protein